MQTYKYYRNGKLHRDDGPAVIRPDGTQEWYKEGKLYIENRPTIIYKYGSENSYNNNKLYGNNGHDILSSRTQEYNKHEKILCKL